MIVSESTLTYVLENLEKIIKRNVTPEQWEKIEEEVDREFR